MPNLTPGQTGKKFRRDAMIRRERFVDEYLKDLNVRAAYARAGFKSRPSLAGRQAWLVLQEPRVQEMLKTRRAAIEKRTDITHDKVRLELGRVAFIDPRLLFDEKTGQLIDIHKLPQEVAAAISSIDVTWSEQGEKLTKIRLCSKVEALDKLCRHLRMYAEPPVPVNNNTFVNVDLRGEWSEIIGSRSRELSGPPADPT